MKRKKVWGRHLLQPPLLTDGFMLQMSETADCISSATDGIRQITRIILSWQRWSGSGEVGAKEAREHPDKNIITRAVGAGEEVEADFFEVELKKDDLHLNLYGRTHEYGGRRRNLQYYSAGCFRLRNAPDFL